VAKSEKSPGRGGRSDDEQRQAFFWNLNGMISGARGEAEPGAFFDRNKIS
jgi:hypothetical protein